MRKVRVMGDSELEDFFAAGRSRDVPEALKARVLAEAEALQPRARPAEAGPVRRPAPSALAALLAAIGGWRGASGLTAAVVAGFWIGLADPGGITSALQGGEQIELLPGSADILTGPEEG